jgi:hypothetical protein
MNYDFYALEIELTCQLENINLKDNFHFGFVELINIQILIEQIFIQNHCFFGARNQIIGD